MTTPQRISLMSTWWPDACHAQGWNPQDRSLRMRILSAAVGRELASANDLNNRDDVDRVKAYLKSLSDDLKAARELDHPEDGRARRLRSKVLDQVKCLALYPLTAPMGRPGAERYVRAIIRDKFHRAGAEPQPFDDLPFRAILDSVDASPKFVRRPPCHNLREIPSHLAQLVMTIAGRLHNKKTGLRVQAGHTMHDMHLAAGLECFCSECNKRRHHPVAAPQQSAAIEAECPF